LAPLVQARPLPRPLPDWDAPAETWSAYGRATLSAMYPNLQWLIDKATVEISDHTNLLAIGFRDDKLGMNVIQFDTDLLRAAVREPEDFAVLIGHEFGHLMVDRDYRQDYRGTHIRYARAEAAARQQFEADLIATLPLERGECHLADTLQRIITSPIIADHTTPKYLAPEVVRITRLRAMCAANY